VRARGFDLGAEQTFGPLQLDYKAAANRSNVNRGNGKGAVLINRISNVGWILDRRESDLHPRFIQTEGPDITNPANYRPAPNGLTNANADNDRAVKELHFNARYTLPISALKADLKTGAQWRENSGTDKNRGRRWNYLGTTALPAGCVLVGGAHVAIVNMTPSASSPTADAGNSVISAFHPPGAGCAGHTFNRQG
jgi:hypothetical protein